MKKVILILIISTLIISTIGCTQSDLENYKAAMDKTDSMSKGSSIMEIESRTKYNTEGLNEEFTKMLSKFENTKITVKSYFDNDIKKSKDEGYLVIGGLGYDLNIYSVDEKYYVEPLFLDLKDKKYIELDLEEMVTEGEKSEDLFKAFAIKWSEIIKEDNVMKGKKVLISTDDGEVKSREFTIDLKDEQLKELLLYFIEEVEKNDEYMDFIEEGMYFTNEEEKLTEDEQKEKYKVIFTELKNFIINAKNMKLYYKAYIDIDGYVVQEDIKFSFENETVGSGEFESIKFEMVNQYTNIEKEQSIDFEVPSLQESIKLGDIDFENFMVPREGGN